MEEGSDRIAANQAQAAPISLDELLRGDPLRHEYGKAGLRRHFPLRQGILPRRAQPQEQVGHQVVKIAWIDDGRIVLLRSRLIPQERKDPARRAEGAVACRSGRRATGVVRRNQERRQFAPENVPRQECLAHVDVCPRCARWPAPRPTRKLSACLPWMPTPRLIPAACSIGGCDALRYPQRPSA